MLSNNSLLVSKVPAPPLDKNGLGGLTYDWEVAHLKMVMQQLLSFSHDEVDSYSEKCNRQTKTEHTSYFMH
jgi:hypothetical protein